MATIRLKTLHGTFHVPLTSQGMIQKIRQTGGFELHKLRLFFLWSRLYYGEGHQGAFLDVGANVGTTSIPASHSPMVSEVVSIEMVPELARLLLKGIQDSDPPVPIYVNTVAAGRIQEDRTAYLHPSNCGDNRLTPSQGAWREITVPICPLDDVLSEGLGGQGPTADTAFVWVDVQGWETEVLAGAVALRQRQIPWFIELWVGLQEPEEFFEILEATWTRLIDVRQRVVRPITDARKIFKGLLDTGNPGAHTDLFLIH